MEAPAIQGMAFVHGPFPHLLAHRPPIAVFLPVTKGFQPISDIRVKEREKKVFQFSVGGGKAVLPKPMQEIFFNVKGGVTTVDNVHAWISTKRCKIAGVKDSFVPIGLT